jgi:hypothetical protein
MQVMNKNFTLDISRARHYLDYDPKVSLWTALDEFCGWWPGYSLSSAALNQAQGEGQSVRREGYTRRIQLSPRFTKVDSMSMRNDANDDFDDVPSLRADSLDDDDFPVTTRTSVHSRPVPVVQAKGEHRAVVGIGRGFVLCVRGLGLVELSADFADGAAIGGHPGKLRPDQ